MAKASSTSASASVFKKLSSVFLVSSSLFAKASPAKQTEALTSAGGLPVLFIGDFSEMTDRARIRDKLLAGKDCSIELEFNDIVLTDEDKRCLELIKPILAKINDIGPKYPWLPEVDPTMVITFGETSITRNGYTMKVTLAKKVWDRASKYWAGIASRAPGELYEYITGSGNNYIRTYKDEVKVGCQTITRSDVEHIARHYGWAPVLA